MPLDDRITPVSINPLELVQRTRSVDDERQRERKDNQQSEKRKKDSLELSLNAPDEESEIASHQNEYELQDKLKGETPSHIDVIIH